jgi:A/G-specific adenine glycosylase
MGARPRLKPNRIRKLLLDWYTRGHRDLPWRKTSDPYRIWVSEIMLQQTRAQAVVPYYHRFLERFPDIAALAAAAEPDVLAAWSGLGYYSRARNLHLAAQQTHLAGAFPADYHAIRNLPGVGDYTAAAIASIAFGLPHAVVDGNVLRVVARVEGDSSDIGSSRTRDRFRQIAQSWLEPKHPGAFNQALMELGATVCLARNPLCLVCPLSEPCAARTQGRIAQLPVKLRKTTPVHLKETLLLVVRRGRVLLRLRESTASRMAGFWELPSAEHLPRARQGKIVGDFRHTITHHHYKFTVIQAAVSQPGASFDWFHPVDMVNIPLSTTARKALQLAKII